MSELKNDMMPMGMPPVMVDYEDFAQFMAQDERLKEQQAEIDDLKTKADRLVVLAVKHCPHNHRDWEEIRKYWDGTA